MHHPCLASAAPVLSCYSRQPQKYRLIVSCHVAFPPHVRVIEVARKNHGVGGKNTLLYLSRSVTVTSVLICLILSPLFTSFCFNVTW